ncbi:mannosyl-oligosaccharide glucosidase, glycoside hydrolase family 63 protein [Pseudohyphozyma bogoriensis]|nr:mannosyl-oligosaccharide glucosidase, glycoside hydrolase family 63 protein [Pseudohyphozyma bogoriensis]
MKLGLTSSLALLASAGLASAELSSDFASHAFAANQSSLWGTYRPNLYFGLRPRVPNSLMTGLMWWGAQDYQSYARARHACDQGDGLESYTFTEHDGRSGAIEVIKDAANNVELRIEFLKIPGGDAGGSWGMRIKGQPLDPVKGSRVTLVNYFGNDGPLGYLELDNEEDEEGLEGVVKLKGSAQGLGEFTLRIVDGPNNGPLSPGPHAEDFGERLDRTQFYGAPVPAGNIWQAKNILMNSFLTNVQSVVEAYKGSSPPDPAILFALPNEVRYGATLYGFQKTYEGKFELDIYFDSAATPSTLDSATLTAGLAASSALFHDRFARTFPNLQDNFSPSQIAFAESITSNLVGGIGYFVGSSIIDRNFAHEWDDEDVQGREPKPEMTDPRVLFTATPSRSFFPRGFYWDEGFHLLVIGAWDNDLSLEILKDWVNLIDEDGWVAREQILGEEARSKVPQEFQTQYPSYANPPTLAMAVTAYIERLRAAGLTISSLEGASAVHTSITDALPAEVIGSFHVTEPALAGHYLRAIYTKFKRHFEWFGETQRGQIKEWGRKAGSRTEAYRWRGRTQDHVLTSGLDDYPRARPPHFGELHLDLISWMGFFSKTMGEIAEFLGEEDDLLEFKAKYEDIVGNIEDLHWSEEEQMYCDASVDEDDESFHVCHKGYISLFPFLLGLLPPDSAHLGPILDMIRSPDHLWSPYGIRSLSKSDPYFGQGENYWRGPIWIQMNYMALSSLYKIYAAEPGPNQVRAGEIYAELRQNVINNVYKEYERTGYVWEQYDPISGEGKRSHPFTGWTSLVTLIMAEKY